MTAPTVQSAAAYHEQILACAAALSTASAAEQGLLYERLGWGSFVLGEVRTTALMAFSEMRALAVAQGDRRLEALALNGLACCHDRLGQRHQSLREAEAAEQIASELRDDRLLALALNNQGQYYKEVGPVPQAAALFARVGAIGEALGDQQLMLAGQIGVARATPMSQPDLALARYHDALALAEELGDRQAQAVCYNNLADWYVNLGQYEESIVVREQGQALCRELGSKEGLGRALIGLAKAYTLLDDLDQAWAYLKRGLPVILGAGDVEGELHSYLNIAHLYVRQDDVLRACTYYQLALEKALAAPDTACALFAQRALDELAAGQLPRPAILPPRPLTPQSIQEDVVLARLYPTNDRGWTGD